MNKVLSIVLLTAILFTSCKKVSVNDSTGPAYITFAPAFTLEVETKTGNIIGLGDKVIEAQVIGSLGNANLNNFTKIYVDNSTGESNFLNHPVLFTRAGGSFPQKILYPIERGDDFLINLKAYAPKDTPEDTPEDIDVAPSSPPALSVVRADNTVTFKGLDGRVDVLVTQVQVAGTFEEPGIGQGSAYEGKSTVPLTFQRGLSKVSFKIAALPREFIIGQDAPNTAEKARDAWGNILKIELVDHPNSVSLDLTSNIFTTGGVPDRADIVVHESTNINNPSLIAGWDIPAAAESEPKPEESVAFDGGIDAIPGDGAMVPAHETITIRITSTKLGSRTVTFDKVLEINTHHIFTLKLDENLGVLMSVNLIDWTTSDEPGLEI